MSDARARLADALQEHGRYATGIPPDEDKSVDYSVLCQCGSDFAGADYQALRVAHADHVADVLLSLAGIAVVELPEPQQEQPGWKDFGIAQVREDMPGEVGLPVIREPFGWATSNEARSRAALLLAAANAADAVTP